MNVKAKPSGKSISIPRDQHGCIFYGNQVEQFDAVVPFIKEGLTNGKKCIYVFSVRSRQTVLEALQQANLPVKKYLETKQLELYDREEYYLQDGTFSPDNVVQKLQDMEEKALAEGYTGLYATGEVTWFFRSTIPISQLLDYETRLNYHLSKHDAVVLCQYSKKHFTPSHMVNVVQRIHQ